MFHLTANCSDCLVLPPVPSELLLKYAQRKPSEGQLICTDYIRLSQITKSGKLCDLASGELVISLLVPCFCGGCFPAENERPETSKKVCLAE